MLDEHTLKEWVLHLVHFVEAAGAIVVFVGTAIAFVRFVSVGLRERLGATFAEVRADLGHFLLLGLDFQLASDVLRTAIAPTLRQIAELAAVAAIRTALNFFLTREIRDAEKEAPNRGEPRE
ncbi:MAG TPA: DUF1622 domain-containing protein [Frankiaceae bacterium]|nr:DUF1622 domain-containing protein [Frankiaceae bacterium]